MNTARNLTLATVVVLAALLFLLKPADQESSISSESTVEPIFLYCAAGMKPPVEEIAKAYEAEYGVPIQIQYGGSGTLLNNLLIADRGDLYLSADASYIDIAREKNLVDEAIPVARLRPVIAVAKGNPKSVRSLDDLMREEVSFALANPDAASIGRVTKACLERTGGWEAMEEAATVFKPTVNDLANDVKLGAVDAAVIWDAVANQYPDIESVPFPEGEEFEQKVMVGVLKSTKAPTASLQFARYLTARDKGLVTFAGKGYESVQGDVWAEVPEITLFSGGVNRLAIQDLLDEFEEREGVRINRVYNGCGILVAQMKAGEIPDAYFACDVSFMDDVGDLFLDSVNVAETDMVILTQKGNPKGIEGMNGLTQEGLVIGVTNPEQSALGKLTKDLLIDAGIYDEVKKNIAVGTPTADLLVNQTLAGALDAAVVYAANCAKVKDKLEIISMGHPKALAIQPYAVANESDHRYLMERLLERIQSDRFRQVFEEVGFRIRFDSEGPS